MEALRQELVERIEDHLYEHEMVIFSRADQQFHFVQSQIVVLDAGVHLTRPEELTEAIPKMSLGSIFYHFIEARRRTPDKTDDFSAWLAGWGEKYEPLRNAFKAIDPYFSSLKALRTILHDECSTFFGGGQS